MRSALALLLFASVSLHAQSTHLCTQSAITVNESAGPLTIELTRSQDLLQPSVGYIEISGSGRWSPPRGFHRLEFAANETRRIVTVPVDDDAYTGTQTTTASCGNIVGTVVTQTGTVQLTVLDDETPPVLVVPSTFEVTETNAAQNIEIPVAIDHRFGRGGFVRVEAIDLTTSSTDYRLNSAALLFDPDESTDKIRLRINGDLIPELYEELILRLSGDVATREIRVRIVDDDAPLFPFTFSQASYAFDEQAQATVTIERSGDRSTAIAATLRPRLPQDVASIVEVPVLFAPGEASKTVTVPLQDSFYTGDRTGTFDLTYPDGILARAPLTVRDDETVPVLSILGGTIQEGNLPERSPARFTLALSTPLGFRLPVAIKTVDGTATRSDYTSIDSTFTFPAGQQSFPLEVFIKGDRDIEPDETFTVSIVNCCGTLATAGTTSATITILNDELYKLDELPLEWNESQKWLTATVLRLDDLDRATSVTASLAPFFQSARAYPSRTVEFQPNETRKEVRFYIDDFFHSASPDVTLTLTGPGILFDRRTLRIVDDEATPVVSIADADVTERATKQRKELLISVSPPSDRPILLSVKETAGTASSGDFRDLPRTITIPALSHLGSVPFTLLGDALPEDVETFALTLTAATSADPGQLQLAKGQAVCTIHDDDAGARLTFASDHLERGTSATITLEMDAPAPTSAVIPLASTHSEVLEVPASLQIAAGSRTATFQVSGLRSGIAAIEATLPPWLGPGKTATELTVYKVSLPVLPSIVRLAVDETVTVSVSLTPPADHEVQLPLESIDLRIAATDRFVTIPAGGTGTFQVKGARVGSNLISIELPNDLGGTVAHIPVEVREP